MQKLVAAALVAGWVAYLGATSYVIWRILSGDTPTYLENYTLGTNAAWATVGIMLWLATEWARGFRG